MGHNQTKDANGKLIDIEQVEMLYQFLQGEQVEGVKCEHMPRLSEDEAFSVIYFLQEGLELLPDRIEQCQDCKQLIDSDAEGYHKEGIGHYCDSCSVDI